MEVSSRLIFLTIVAVIGLLLFTSYCMEVSSRLIFIKIVAVIGLLPLTAWK